ncbi:hypothetical protein [Sulfuracidifex tepidarius]|uniref:hypothetical protein n=1 Tax=Sulfuracidifex tepidarius TaxID=1294262 RepID=UPI0006D17CF3|nr:hypothetical protein [Sulfuracidifex tepidarius]
MVGEVALPSLALVSSYQPPDVGKVDSSLTLPSSMSYLVKQINATVTGVTKQTSNSTKSNTTSSTMATKKINATYLVNYSVIKYNSYGNLTVKISGNYTTQNISFYKGNFTINPELDPFTLEYPFVLPNYLANLTYGISSPSSSLVFEFLKQVTVNLNGNQETAYDFKVIDSAGNYNMTVLSNGVIYYLDNSTFNMSLKSFNTFTLSLANLIPNLNQSDINSTYQYSIYEFNPTAATLLPTSEIEVFYPLVFSNGVIALNEFELRTLPNESVVASRSIDGVSVYNYLSLNELNETFTTFSPQVGNKNITFNGENFMFVNQTKVTTPAGTFTSYLYKNVSSAGTLIQYLYLGKDGLLLKLKEVSVSTGTPITEGEISFIGNNYIPPSVSFPYHSLSDTNLPYKPVNSYDSMIIAVIVTLVIVAILLLLHRRFG